MGNRRKTEQNNKETIKEDRKKKHKKQVENIIEKIRNMKCRRPILRKSELNKSNDSNGEEIRDRKS